MVVRGFCKAIGLRSFGKIVFFSVFAKIRGMVWCVPLIMNEREMICNELPLLKKLFDGV